MAAERIFLIGMMGSGKSHWLKQMAKWNKSVGYDLDALIEMNEEKTIAEIFNEDGEVYFRKLEHQILEKLINNQESFILSLGGGTPCYSNNHEFLKSSNVISIYLKASVETLYDRLLYSNSERPLIANKNPEEMKEFIAKSLFDRSYYYNQAKYKVSIDERTKDETAEDILEILT